MNKPLKLLESIQQTAVPEHLFEHILDSIESINKNTIEFKWVQTAAAIFLCIFVSEIYCIQLPEKSGKKESSIIVKSLYENDLYHE